MTDIIDQADRIVGIDTALGKSGLLDYADSLVKNTYRRGAYLEWFASHGADVRDAAVKVVGAEKHTPGAVDIAKMAEVIVALHDATQPKGDGLPAPESIGIDSELREKGWFVVNVMARGGKSESATMCEYIDRCLSAPVRRLLAEFDVTDTAENVHAAIRLDDGSHVIFRKRTK